MLAHFRLSADDIQWNSKVDSDSVRRTPCIQLTMLRVSGDACRYRYRFDPADFQSQSPRNRQYRVSAPLSFLSLILRVANDAASEYGCTGALRIRVPVLGDGTSVARRRRRSASVSKKDSKGSAIAQTGDTREKRNLSTATRQVAARNGGSCQRKGVRV